MMQPSRRRNGYTLTELTVASGLTVFLAVILSSTWAMLNRPTTDLIAWGQLFQEMDITVATLARDLGGGLPEYQNAATPPTLGGKADGCLVMCQQYPPLPALGTHLQLWFSSGSITHAGWFQPVQDGTVIDYYVDTDSNTLVRSNYTPPGTTTPTNFTVARNVSAMSVVPATVGGAACLQITLTFTCEFPNSYRNAVTRTCTLITKVNP